MLKHSEDINLLLLETTENLPVLKANGGVFIILKLEIGYPVGGKFRQNRSISHG